MKTRLLLLVFVLVGISAFLWWSADWFGKRLKPAWRSSRSHSSASSQVELGSATTHPGGRFGDRTTAQPAAPTNVVAAAVPVAAVSTAPATARSHSDTPTPATIALDSLRTTLREYHSMYGGNPVGSNCEITRALNGDNPKQVKFSIADGNSINDKGELVDVWGTPYFFHQLSGSQTEIRSAGPDKQMWSADDLVIR